MSLTASEDAYVHESNATSNYGADTILAIKTDPSKNRYAYVKFSLAGAPTINTAKLRVYGSASAATTLTAYQAVDSWAQGTLTWNNRPTPGSAIAGVAMGTTTQYYEIDVTAYVKAQSDGVASFVLQESAGKYTTLNSRESSSNKPLLVIN